MSDIVSRLKNMHGNSLRPRDTDVLLEAAARISELEADNAALIRDVMVGSEAHHEKIRLTKQLQARIAELEAQLAALRNPPYHVKTGVETLGNGVDDCWWAIYHGDILVLEEWGYDTTDEASIEGKRILSRLTAPFGAKE